YMYRQKKCHDNYTGQNIKMIRTFFNWINDSCGIATGPHHKNFYIQKEEIAIITLTVEQLRFLMFDNDFEAKLSRPLKHAKDVFVLGCMVGLRFSDLCKIKKENIELRDSGHYLKMRSQKTGTDTLVKLPAPAMDILERYKKNKGTLLPVVSLFRFNKNIKKLAELAGWTYPLPRLRTRKGIKSQSQHNTLTPTRFCDALSSHTMRRTSITTMLTSGMPEYVVRKISGHTSDSKAFFRYVSLAQSLMDKEIEKMHVHFEERALVHTA
ncbi:tyrosine-type recombinase/integrase, partial [Ferruginibacter sp. HRS2-29]